MAIARVASVTTAGGVSLLAAGNERHNVIIENSDANRLHIRLDGDTVSASDYSFSLAQNENARLLDFAGEIKGIWAADGTGYAHVTTY
jgi:hypothetical protein